MVIPLASKSGCAAVSPLPARAPPAPLASVWLDADKYTYEALCTSGAAAITVRPSFHSTEYGVSGQEANTMSEGVDVEQREPLSFLHTTPVGSLHIKSYPEAPSARDTPGLSLRLQECAIRDCPPLLPTKTKTALTSSSDVREATRGTPLEGDTGPGCDAKSCPTSCDLSAGSCFYTSTTSAPHGHAWDPCDAPEDGYQSVSSDDRRSPWMNVTDTDARLDVLEEVELCSLVPVLPRTFGVEQLVQQLVPCTRYFLRTAEATASTSSRKTMQSPHLFGGEGKRSVPLAAAAKITGPTSPPRHQPLQRLHRSAVEMGSTGGGCLGHLRRASERHLMLLRTLRIAAGAPVGPPDRALNVADLSGDVAHSHHRDAVGGCTCGSNRCCCAEVPIQMHGTSLLLGEGVEGENIGGCTTRTPMSTDGLESPLCQVVGPPSLCYGGEAEVNEGHRAGSPAGEASPPRSSARLADSIAVRNVTHATAGVASGTAGGSPLASHPPFSYSALPSGLAQLIRPAEETKSCPMTRGDGQRMFVAVMAAENGSGCSDHIKEAVSPRCSAAHRPPWYERRGTGPQSESPPMTLPAPWTSEESDTPYIEPGTVPGMWAAFCPQSSAAAVPAPRASQSGGCGHSCRKAVGRPYFAIAQALYERCRLQRLRRQHLGTAEGTSTEATGTAKVGDLPKAAQGSAPTDAAEMHGGGEGQATVSTPHSTQTTSWWKDSTNTTSPASAAAPAVADVTTGATAPHYATPVRPAIADITAAERFWDAVVASAAAPRHPPIKAPLMTADPAISTLATTDGSDDYVPQLPPPPPPPLSVPFAFSSSPANVPRDGSHSTMYPPDPPWERGDERAGGAVVEWTSGTVSYTADTQGLVEEQQARARRFYLLPPPPPSSPFLSVPERAAGRALARDSERRRERVETDLNPAEAGVGEDESAMQWRVGKDCLPKAAEDRSCLRGATLAQLQRLHRLRRRIATTIVHVTAGEVVDQRAGPSAHPTPCPSEAPTPTPALPPYTSSLPKMEAARHPGRNGRVPLMLSPLPYRSMAGMTAAASAAGAVSGNHCTCVRCAPLLVQFAQVPLLASPVLRRFFDYLHQTALPLLLPSSPSSPAPSSSSSSLPRRRRRTLRQGTTPLAPAAVSPRPCVALDTIPQLPDRCDIGDDYHRATASAGQIDIAAIPQSGKGQAIEAMTRVGTSAPAHSSRHKNGVQRLRGVTADLLDIFPALSQRMLSGRRQQQQQRRQRPSGSMEMMHEDESAQSAPARKRAKAGSLDTVHDPQVRSSVPTARGKGVKAPSVSRTPAATGEEKEKEVEEDALSMPCWVDDAVLDEAVTVGVVPEGEPHRLRLVAPSRAFCLSLVQRLEEVAAAAIAILRFISVPAYCAVILSYNVPRWRCWLVTQYFTATWATLQTCLTSMEWREVTQLARDSPYLSAWCGVVTGRSGEAVTDAVDELLDALDEGMAAALFTQPSTRTAVRETLHSVQLSVFAAAELHSRACLSSAEDLVARVILTALTPILHRRITVMYELLRHFASKSLYASHRQQCEAFQNWYAMTPSPASILRLLQRSRRFSGALRRCYPQYIFSSSAPSPPLRWNGGDGSCKEENTSAPVAIAPESRLPYSLPNLRGEADARLTTDVTRSASAMRRLDEQVGRCSCMGGTANRYSDTANPTAVRADEDGLGESHRWCTGTTEGIQEARSGASFRPLPCPEGQASSTLWDVGQPVESASPYVGVTQGSAVTGCRSLSSGSPPSLFSSAAPLLPSSSPTRSTMGTRDYVPEVALLDPRYLQRFAWWTHQLHHGGTGNAVGGAPASSPSPSPSLPSGANPVLHIPGDYLNVVPCQEQDVAIRTILRSMAVKGRTLDLWEIRQQVQHHRHHHSYVYS